MQQACAAQAGVGIHVHENAVPLLRTYAEKALAERALGDETQTDAPLDALAELHRAGPQSRSVTLLDQGEAEDLLRSMFALGVDELASCACMKALADWNLPAAAQSLRAQQAVAEFMLGVIDVVRGAMSDQPTRLLERTIDQLLATARESGDHPDRILYADAATVLSNLQDRRAEREADRA